MVSDKELPPNGSLQVKVSHYQPMLPGQSGTHLKACPAHTCFAHSQKEFPHPPAK